LDYDAEPIKRDTIGAMSGLPVSVVIPVYNSESHLPQLVERLEAVLRVHASSFEVIFVEDGSLDLSWDLLRDLANTYSFITAIKLMRNYGQHNALLCGIRAARNDVIVTMDDDLQNPPEEIPALLQKLEKGYDVVYGTPQQKQHGFWRNIASDITKIALQSVMGAETARSVSAFRVFRTSLRAAFAEYRGPHVSIDVLLTWGTRRFAAVAVRQDARLRGRSNYTFASLLRHAVNMLTGFSTVPLRVASVVGFAFTAFGGGLLLFILARYLLQGTAVPGFVFLASTITILSGAQLFALGVIGEYLARMHFRMLEKPTYTVSCMTGAAEREAHSALPENEEFLRAVITRGGQA
jgi:undecaprenyl-phosphate 4-deoxy-4-formamido-L-arabinose transferase